MRCLLLSILSVIASGASSLACGNVDPQRPAIAYPMPIPYETRIQVVRPQAPTVVISSGVPTPEAPSTTPPPTAARSTDILITTARKVDRPTELVGVIDEHEASGRQDEAFALLRRRAFAMGADAVLGVEFHHGEESGESTHLSGLAVRYTDRPLRPGEWP